MWKAPLKRGNRREGGEQLDISCPEDEEFDLYIDTLEPYDTIKIQLEGGARLLKEECKKNNRVAVSETERA